MLIVCNGMTRAGSTLQYNLVRHLALSSGNGVGEGFFQISTLPAAVDSWQTDAVLHVIKMHDVWAHAPNSMLRRCYIYRDIRDVAASAYRKFPLSFKELISVLQEAIQTDHRIKNMQEVLVQRYEQVFSDPVTATRELAKFLDANPTEAECQTIVSRCLEESQHSIDHFHSGSKRQHARAQTRTRWIKRFASAIPSSAKDFLKRRGLPPLHQNLTKTRSQSHAVTLLHPDHFSPTQGQAGTWQHVFTANQIDRLHAEFHAWLSENHYPPYDSFDTHQRRGTDHVEIENSTNS